MTGSDSGATASDVGACFVPADPAKAGADRGDEVAAPAAGSRSTWASADRSTLLTEWVRKTVNLRPSRTEQITLGSCERDEQRHLTEVLRCPGAGGGRLPAWRTERACGPLTAEHEKGDTDMKGWAEPEHLHAQPGSQTAWVGEVA